MKKIFISIFLLFIFTISAFAQDINFEAAVDRKKVSLGESVQLSLSLYGTQNAASIDLPDIEGFDQRYLGPSSRMSIVNGKVSSSITYVYTLIPLKSGALQIPAISIEYKGKTYASKPISIEVVKGRVSSSAPGGGQEASENKMEGLEDRVFLTMEADKTKAYLNEIIPITIKLYVNNLPIRDIQYPELMHDKFSADKLGEPMQYRDNFSGASYDVIEFNTNIFALSAGELSFGPAQLKCSLMIKDKSRRRRRSFFFDDDFFGRYQKYPLILKSPNIPITVMNLPKTNVPESFSGALGSYRFDMGVQPKEVNVGDPLTLKMVISGSGNFKTVKIPISKNLKNNFKVYDPSVKQQGNSKAFEQVIIPKTDKVTQIPQFTFNFFNPNAQQYKTITKGPILIKVTKPANSEGLKVVENPYSDMSLRGKEMLGRDIIYIKEFPGSFKKKSTYLYKNKLFYLFNFLFLIFLACAAALYKEKQKLKTNIKYARFFHAPKKAKKGIKEAQRLLNEEKVGIFYNAIFKTLQEYLGNKFHVPAGGITQNFVHEVLSPKGVRDDILNKITDIFSDCDRSRYAPIEFSREQMQVTLGNLEEAVDYLERKKL